MVRISKFSLMGIRVYKTYTTTMGPISCSTVRTIYLSHFEFFSAHGCQIKKIRAPYEVKLLKSLLVNHFSCILK